MTCSTCGAVLRPDGLVCDGCGAPTTRTLFFEGDVSRPLSFGRDPSCDIVLDLPVVSGRHGQVRWSEGALELRDSGSRNGTFVDGTLALAWVRVGPESEVRLGSYHVPDPVLARWRQRLSGVAVEETSAPTVRLAVGQSLLLGRDPGAGVSIDHPTVSWHHARVERRADGLYLSDLRSTNGTFVNGARIRRARIAPTDQVRLGSVPVAVGEGEVSAGRTYRGEVRLDVRGVTRRLEDGRVLLDAVSLSVFPGEMVALMGPSGAGKTTLLELLTGQRLPSAGSVTLNDLDLHEHRESLSHMIGYVPQEDVMHRDLTVFEVLFHAARLRLPSDLPDAAVTAQVDALIARIGLAHVRDTPIGGEAVRGISGGQRKRVNIAIELLTEPPLLFLDEPTSGLDATATLEVLQLLRSLAQEGRTILMTVHQPRREAFRLMDMLILLEKGGRLAYYGPADPQAATYFEAHAGAMPKGANPADFVLDVLDAAKAPPGTWQARYRQSALYGQYVDARLAERGAVELRASADRRRGVPGPLRQVGAMLRRHWDRKRRDRDALVLQALQPVVVGALLAWVFHGGEGWPFRAPAPEPLPAALPDAAAPLPVPPDPCASDAVLALQAAAPVHAVLFLLAATAFWLGCSNVARELVAERAVFRRERMAGLSTGAYLTAGVLAQAAVGVLQVLTLVAFAWGGDLALHTSAFTGAGLAFLTLLCGVAVGTVVSASVRTEVTAISTLPLLLLPQLMLAGYIVLWRDLSGALSALASIMPVRWAFQAFTSAEYAAAAPACSLEAAIGFADGEMPVAVLGATTLLALGVAWARLARTATEGA